MLAGAALFLSPVFLMKAAAQDSPPPSPATSSAKVEFVHPGEGGSPGQSNFGDYSASVSASDPDTGDVYYGDGGAAVTVSGNDVSDLHASANASSGGNPEGVAGIATFSETDLVFNPSSSASPNFETFNFNVSGTLTGYASAIFSVDYGSYSTSYTLESGSNPISVQVPTSDLTINLDDNSYYGSFSESLSASVSNGGNPGTNLSDFSDTVHLTSIDVTDANGDSVAGTFTDGGQVFFAANTTITPEPNTTALLASSALLLAFLMKRRLRAA
jgi:hypothetical protein